MSDCALNRLWGTSLAATSGLLAVTGVLALAGSRFAAWLMVGAATVGAAADVVLSVAKYRRTMRRPWPAVRPLPDDDW
jgi:hypothetical protein